MKRNVTISVLGEQYFDGVAPNQTELLTEGTLEETEKGWLLRYEESEITGMEGTTTIFDIGVDEVTLRREGVVQSEMYFRCGEISTSELKYHALPTEMPVLIVP